MPSPVVAQTEDFARLFFHAIEDLAEPGTWIPAAEAFARTADRHAWHPYVSYVEAKPARHIRFTRVSEQIRGAEFKHIERRKTGAWRSAPVFFRVGPQARALVPAVPRELVGGAAATERMAPDLALLDRALADEREGDAAAVTLARPRLPSAFERACMAFDWQQPSWPERLLRALRSLLQSLSRWGREAAHGPSRAA